MSPECHADLQYALDCANIGPRAMPFIDPEDIRAIDSAMLYGIPIRELSATEAKAFLIMMGRRYLDRYPFMKASPHERP